MSGHPESGLRGRRANAPKGSDLRAAQRAKKLDLLSTLPPDCWVGVKEVAAKLGVSISSARSICRKIHEGAWTDTRIEVIRAVDGWAMRARV